MAESQIRRALRSVIGAPSRPVRRALSAPLNAGALSEWAAFEAGFFPSLAPLHQRLVRAPLEDARHRHDHSWRLPDKLFPYSCTDEEGLAMAYVVQANSLKRGFEIATAFGFSSAYLGLALKAAGGRLTSLDCYIEEWKESFDYDDAELAAATEDVRRRVAAGELPSGLQFARESAALLGLTDAVDYEVGLSPQDVGLILGERTLDFAFIDGGHFGEQPLRDFKAVEPCLEPRCAVFFHDNNHNPSVAQAIAYAEQSLGVRATRLKTRFSLTVVARGLDDDSLRRLARVIAHRRLG